MLRRWLLLLSFGLPMPMLVQATELSLEAAVAEALAYSPGTAMWKARAEAATVIAPQVGSLPDPRLSMGVENLPLSTNRFGSTEMTMLKLVYRQDLPGPGKRALMRRSAEQDAGASYSDYSDQQLSLAREVRSTWWELFALQRTLDILKQSQNLLRQSAAIAQGRYKVGLGEQQEVLLIQLESSRLLSREFEIKGRQAAAIARLNAWLGRATGTVLTLPVNTPTTLPALLVPTRLHELARSQRPFLQAAQQRLDAARTRLDLARLDRRPDYMVEAAYGQRPRYTDMVSVMVSVSLPIYSHDKQDRAVDQRNSELLAGQYELQDQLLQIDSTIAQSHAEYQQLREQYHLLTTGIIPQARQAVDTLMAGYQVNTASFNSLLNAEVMFNDYQMQQWQLFAQAQQTIARLQAITGVESIYE